MNFSTILYLHILVINRDILYICDLSNIFEIFMSQIMGFNEKMKKLVKFEKIDEIIVRLEILFIL